jgi:hypothetical protein
MTKEAKTALTLLEVMHGHGRDKARIIDGLLVAYVTMLEPAGFGLANVRGGAQSFFFFDHDDTSRQFHIRSGGKGKIVIQSHYQKKMSTPWIMFNDEYGVIRWATRLVKEKQQAQRKLKVAA